MTLVDPVLDTLALMQPGDDGEIDLLATLLQRPAWMADAACIDEPSERFFAVSTSEPAAWALAACGRCPVRSTCLEFALEHEEAGIWGGTTERDRMRLLRQEGRGATWTGLSSDRRSAVLDAALALRADVQPLTACEHCGEPASGRYCSPRCCTSASYHRRRAAPCEFCGGVTPKQYCSPECRISAWERRQAEKLAEPAA